MLKLILFLTFSVAAFSQIYKFNPFTQQMDDIGPAGAGAGTVTSVSVTTANGVSGSVATATTTPAITLTLGAIVPTTVNGLTITTSASGVLTITAGKTATVSNTLTFTGTDGSSVAFGTGGTVLYNGGALGTPSSATLTSATGYLWSALASPPFIKNAQVGTYQVLAADFTLCKTITVASGTFTITLVASGAQPADGQCLNVLNYGSGVVTVARSGQNINGAAANLTLAAGSASAPTGLRVNSDGTNYFAQPLTAGGGDVFTTAGATFGAFSYDFTASTVALSAVHLRSDTSYTMDAGTVITTNLSATLAGFRLTAGTLPSAQVSGNLFMNSSGIPGWSDGTNASAAIGILGSGAAYPTAPTSGHNVQWSAAYKLATTGSAVWAVANGGIGAATITGIMQGNGTSAVTGISNSSTVGQVLRVTGAATYAWGALDLADGDAITGIIPAANNTVVVLDGSVGYCADAGANDTYTCSLSPAPAGYVTGARYRFKANTLNTGAASINFNSLGAKTIVKVAGGITTALATNDILAGQVVELAYDGTNMQMQSTLGNAGGGAVSNYYTSTTGTGIGPTSFTPASTDTLRIHDDTPTTGVTHAVVRAGDADDGTANGVLELQNSSGQAGFTFESAGSMRLMIGRGAAAYIGTSSDTGFAFNQTAGSLAFGSTLAGASIRFTGLNYYDAADLAIGRNAAGVFEINNGSAGTYRDLLARHVTFSGANVLFSALAAASGTPDSVCLNTNTLVRNAALTCTVSSENVKNNIGPIPGTMDDFMAIKPLQFAYNDQPGRTRWGFGAQQVASVNPALADGWRSDGQPWSLDQNAILALTVKTVQELTKKIEQLEKR